MPIRRAVATQRANPPPAAGTWAQFRVGLRVRFDDAANVFCQLRSLDFQTRSATRGKPLQTSHVVLEFLKPFVDRFASPTEPALRLAWIPIAQFQGYLCHEQTSLMALEPIDGLLKQQLVAFHGSFHDSILARWLTNLPQLPFSPFAALVERAVHG
jgi:hypothetical protein